MSECSRALGTDSDSLEEKVYGNHSLIFTMSFEYNSRIQYSSFGQELNEGEQF